MMSQQESSSVCIDEYIPDGILGNIFRHCPSESYDTLRMVSKRWDKLVDRYVGRVLIVNTGNAFMVDPDSNLDRMSIRANYWMTLSSERCVTGNSACSETEKEGAGDQNISGDVNVIDEVEKLQDISNPDSVRKIGFVGQLGIGYKPLESILGPCQNITSLFLHLSLFAQSKQRNATVQKYEPWLVSCCIPHLKELAIDNCGMSCEDSANLFSFKATLLSLATFLCSQKFVRLEKAIFALPYLESTEGILVRTLCIFLARHAESLKTFSFTQKYELSEDEEDASSDESSSDAENERCSSPHQHLGDGDRRKKGKSAFNFSTSVNYLSLSQLALSAKELKHVSLDELYVVLARKQESGPVWKNLLIKQTNLKKCIFAGDKIPLPEGAIIENAPTLVTLQLDIRDGVNLECFRSCVHLKHLSLGGRNDADESCDGDDNDDMESSSSEGYHQPIQLKNAKCLPSGLESLEIVNLRTHKEEAKILALELPSLKDLTLKNVGWEGQLGLTLSDLVKIYERGKLDHLFIKASLNMMSYSELEDESVSPELNLFACVVQSNSFAAASRFFLEAWKRKDGLYSTRKITSSLENEEDEELDVFQVPIKVELRENEEKDASSSSSESGSESEEVDEKNGDIDEDEEDGEAGKNDKGDGSEEEWQECESEDSEEN